MGWDRPKKREKKNFVPIFVLTRPGEENYEKNSKNIQKIKKPLSGIIFSQNGDEIGREIGENVLVSNSVHTRPGQENYKKNSKKIKKKN